MLRVRELLEILGNFGRLRVRTELNISRISSVLRRNVVSVELSFCLEFCEVQNSQWF